jgi:Flp pilus assembly protein TadG
MRTAAAGPARQRGVAAVELALVIIPLLLLVFGVSEFGRAIFQYNTLAKATRGAARFLSTQGSGLGHAQAVCLAVHGDRTCTAPTLVSGLSASNISICDATNCPATHLAVQTGTGQLSLVTVTVSGFQFVSLVNFTVFGYTIGAPNITFGQISATMRQEL